MTEYNSIIEKLINELLNIQYPDKEKLDLILQRTKMVIVNIFGESSHHISKLESIIFDYKGITSGSFDPKTGVYQDDTPRSNYTNAWNNGISQLKNLLIVLKENLSLKSLNKDDSFDKCQDIIKSIYEYSIELERMESTFQGKDEEALRDLFISHLNTKYKQTSITAESLNKAGKTDILIRELSVNILIAECKIWKGEKYFLEAIDQLLSYLTWRDKYSALLIFVPNLDINNILNNIRNFTTKHDCFIKFNQQKEESWFEFTFHLVSNKESSFQLNILLFHFPKEKKIKN